MQTTKLTRQWRRNGAALAVWLVFSGIFAGAALGQTGAFLCSNGPNDGRPCDTDDQCPGGVCVFAQGVCQGGEANGDICDCPALAGSSGTAPICNAAPICTSDASLGTCAGGTLNAECCDVSYNCFDDVPCIGTQKICLSGANKAFNCLDDSQCAGARCASTGCYCESGDYQDYSCVDDADCPSGTCFCFVPEPTNTPTQRPTNTPAVTATRTNTVVPPTSVPTNTPGGPTPTRTPTAKATATSAPGTATATSKPTAKATSTSPANQRTATPTRTSKPENTFTPVRTATEAAATRTATLSRPTATRKPTQTVAPTLTPTPVPESVLASNIVLNDVKIPLVDARAFPSSGVVRIDEEEIRYLGKSGNTLIGLQHGQNGTQPTNHAAGAAVSLVVAQAPPPQATATTSEGPINRYEVSSKASCGLVSPRQASGGAWPLILAGAVLLVVRRRR